MSARDAILGKVRRAVAAPGDDPARRKTVEQRLNCPQRNLVPRRAEIDHAAQIALFERMAQNVMASVAHVATSNDVPEQVCEYLRLHNLPQRLRHGADDMIAHMPWRDCAPALETATGPAVASDEVSVSRATVGVAETGTLVMTSGPDNPTTLNFLPENHIVVLQSKDIAGSYEDAWDRIRMQYGKGVMPRTVNMITGPSRTGDIEQRIELGAHGPRRLHIIIVDE